MENDTKPARLLDLPQTAALLRHMYLGGPPVTLPADLPWDDWNERTQFIFAYRCAIRVGFASWYRWYLAAPDITDADIETAKSEMAKIYDPLPGMRQQMLTLNQRGHKNALLNVLHLRDRIIGSGIAFSNNAWAAAPDAADDETVCIRFALEKLPRGQNSFLQGAYEAADAIITNTSRVMREVEFRAKRNATPGEFKVIANALILYLGRGAHRWRQDNMRDILFQEHGFNTFDLGWKDGVLTSVNFKRCDDPKLMTLPRIREVYAAAGQIKLHTGCPARYAYVEGTGDTPNNPYHGVLRLYADAFGKGLGDQDLRAAQNMTLKAELG